MGTIGWGDVKKKKSPKQYNSKKGSDLFVSFPEGSTTLRLVGRPQAIQVAWLRDPKTNKNEKLIVPFEGGYKERLENLKIPVRDYFAVQCFVEGDDKTRIRILEKGNSIFSSFGTWHESFTYPSGHKRAGQNIDPGGNDGPKFIVTTENENNRTKYTVLALQQTPFTKDQLEIISRGNDPEKYKDLPLGERGPIDLKEFYSEKKAAEHLDKRLKELAGIEVDGHDDADDAPISEKTSSSVSSILGDDYSSEEEEDIEVESNDSDDEDLTKKAEEVLGKLF